MNENEKLLRAIGGVGEDLIARADEPVTKTGDKVWYRIAALAACAALVIGVGALVLPKLNLGAKTEAPAAEAPMAEAVAQQETMPEEPKAEEAPAAESAPAEEPKKEGTNVSVPAKEEAPKEETPKSEPQEEEEPKDEEPEEEDPTKNVAEEEDDTPDPDPLQNLDLFDQKYHFVSKSRSKSREAIFTDDEKIGKWWTELFTGEQIYRYGADTVTGTDGSQYPFKCVVIYGRTAAIYEYSEEQEDPAVQEETPAEQTPTEESPVEETPTE